MDLLRQSYEKHLQTHLFSVGFPARTQDQVSYSAVMLLPRGYFF